MSLGKLLKKAVPIAAGAFLGPAAVGGMFPGVTGIMASPFMQRAIMSGGLGLLTGQKPKDAIMSGILGGGLGALMPQQAAGAEQMFGSGLPIGPGGKVSVDQMAKRAVQDTVRGGAGTGAASSVASALSAKPATMSGELLKSLGYAGEGEGNLLFKLMNTRMGEGLAAGLLAQLLSGDEDEGPSPNSYERRPFGAGGPGGKLGGINYANGGEAYFPRRNGGIDPFEGSGKKDDVPAMLMAGEFVMTRDAVKGAGGGDLRKGIQNMYGMMDNFERMA
jgi:hypothetical protein